MSDSIIIFDTTLRDGEQSPGCSMNITEKIKMAHQLCQLKVDVIEAGFPMASPGDFEAVHQIAKEIHGPQIAGLSRANLADIDRAWEAVSPSKNPRIHTFIATSDIHLEHKLKMTKAQVLKRINEAVSHAKSQTTNVEFSAEDATRSDWDFLVEAFECAIEAGATTLNVPDTVGYTIPSEYARLIAYLKENITGIEKAILSVHCHNDLGLAVANSLAAIENGARQVECTINGIGERAGNAALEEIVMGLKVRKETLGLDTNIDTKQIYPTSKLLSHITGIQVQPNKAIVGDNAFAHEAGIHQDGVLKFQKTYEIMTPASVGIPKNKLVLGKHSGRHALKDRLAQLGFTPQESEFDKIFHSFKSLADRKKNVFDEDIIALVDDQTKQTNQPYQLLSLKVQTGLADGPEAFLEIEIEGQKKSVLKKGHGPVDAIYQAICELIGFNGQLERYMVNAITGGMDAQGEVHVTLNDKGRLVRGSGSHTDILMASAMAFLTALNRLKIQAPQKPKKGI